MQLILRYVADNDIHSERNIETGFGTYVTLILVSHPSLIATSYTWVAFFTRLEILFRRVVIVFNLENQ